VLLKKMDILHRPDNASISCWKRQGLKGHQEDKQLLSFLCVHRGLCGKKDDFVKPALCAKIVIDNIEEKMP
jgi:hypothetical protein